MRCRSPKLLKKKISSVLHFFFTVLNSRLNRWTIPVLKKKERKRMALINEALQGSPSLNTTFPMAKSSFQIAPRAMGEGMEEYIHKEWLTSKAIGEAGRGGARL